jgi:DNA primase
MFFDKSYIQQLTDKINIVDVIGARVKLKKSGNNFIGLCPFHNEKTPSFNVNVTKGFFHCFGCGASGSVISFIMKYENLPFVDAVKTLSLRYGIALPEQTVSSHKKAIKEQERYQRLTSIMQTATSFYQKKLQTSNRAKDYLKKRGLSDKIIDKYKIGYAPNSFHNFGQLNLSGADLLACGLQKKNENGNIYDRLRDRITCPIFNNRGSIIGFGARALDSETLPKYLNSPQTELFDKSKELYGMYQVLNSKEKFNHIVLTEGYMDVVSLAQHGINNVIASLGTAVSSHQIQLLYRFWDTIIVCMDSDTAGKKAASKIAFVALNHLKENKQIKFLFLPDNMDPDSYVQQYGKSNLQKLIKESITLDVFLLELIKSQHKGDNVANKNAALNLVNEIITQIKDATYKKLYSEFFSQQLMVNLTDINTQPQVTEKRYKKNHINMTPVRKVIALLLQNPKFCDIVLKKEHIFSLKVKGFDVLKKICDDIKKYNLNTVATLDEHLQEYPSYQHLKELYLWQCGDENEQLKVFSDLLAFFDKQYLRMKKQQLLELFKENKLTQTQEKQLQQIDQELLK